MPPQQPTPVPSHVMLIPRERFEIPIQPISNLLIRIQLFQLHPLNHQISQLDFKPIKSGIGGRPNNVDTINPALY